MRIPQKYIDDLKNGENEQVEFKVKFSNQYIARAICAFANTHGGRLYIGVNDDGTILGLTQEECSKYSKHLHDIASQIKANVKVQIHIDEENRCFIIVDVDESVNRLYSTDGIAYEREGNKTKSMQAKECCVAAIKIDSKCDEIYCKNLAHTIYFFNNRCEEINGQIRLNKEYQNIFPENISISAVVGMNGSGKSALFEIMYRIVNNFSCLLERDLKRNASESLCFVDGLWADLYYVINGDIYCISCRNTNVKLLRNEKELLDLFVKFPEEKEYIRLNQRKLADFNQNWFYSIVTNYSMQSFVCTDFRGEPALQVLKDNKSQKRDGLLWLSGLFHKNDGYITPIVLNPFRDNNGNVDVQNESKLTTNRLASILFYYQNKKEDFIDGYELNRIFFEYNSEYVVEKFIGNNYPSGDYADEIRKKVWNFNSIVVNNPNSYSSIILEIFGYKKLIKPSPNNNVEIDRACAYLVYKVLSIASKYPSYERYEALGDISKFDQIVEEDKRKLLQELITEINKDKSHITTKIRQTKSLLDSVSRKSMVIDSKEIDLQEYYQNVYSGECPKNLTGIMNTLPPPFYTPHIVLDKKIDDKQIEIERMSAGERQFIYMFSTYIYHLCNLLSIQDSKRIKYRNVNLVFDEVEICFHPEYQRTFINKLLSTLSRIGLTRNCSYNIIIATHSPFILSDIPQNNILYLEDGKNVSDTIGDNPFGANINDILRRSFFLKNGFVGEFAKQKILSLVDYLSPNTGKNKNEWTKDSSKYFIDNQIGDEIIKAQLSRLYYSKFDEA